jgi:hypothetical protein
VIALAAFLGLVTPQNLGGVVEAIIMAENSPWSSPGGALQFTERTWREETSLPYSYAQKPEVAKTIARQRLVKHARALEALHIDATAYLLGSMWNRGFVGALALRKQHQKCPYGERVQNLFEAYTK